MAGNLVVSTINGVAIGVINAIINGNFGINQRGVSGTVTLAAGAYGHDRWKAGASGCTYTFATVDNVTTLTISAGSLIQVIEGLNLQSGTYTLSWTGTAQGKIGAGSYAASGVTGTAVGGTNLNIEYGTGTVSLVQLEKGSTATPFEFRSIGQELALCQRYCYRWTAATVGFNYVSLIRQYSSTNGTALIKLPVAMRGTISGSTIPITSANWDYSVTAINPVSNQSSDNNFVQCDVTGSFSGANFCGALGSSGTAQALWIQWTSEL
jgi:hypothetical protein